MRRISLLRTVNLRKILQFPMKKFKFFFHLNLIITVYHVISLVGFTCMADKPRVIVITDGETDDRCSMVHFLLHTNDVQVDAIIQSNSAFQKHGWSGDHWLEQQIDSYATVYPNLIIHDDNYPTPEYLKEKIYVGDEDFTHIPISGKDCKVMLPGAEVVIDPTEWPDTPGSDRIVEVLLEDDPSQIFIQCWGGANTVARALHKLKNDYPEDYDRAVSKVVLYCIWYQDGGGSYIERYHPKATILLNHHFSASWDYGTMTNTTEFVDRYLHNPNNPLGLCYIQSYISEGDTPAFLYAIDNGLRSYESPLFGGWGGQFYKVSGYDNVYRDTGFGGLREWIEPAMHDFQARLQWCVTPEYTKTNHKPIITIPEGLDRTVVSGDTVLLNAIIEDPDPIDVDEIWKTRGEMWSQKGINLDMVKASPDTYIKKWRSGWYQYPGGSYKDFIDVIAGPEDEAWMWFVAPDVAESKTIHIILEAYDLSGVPRLTSYARFIITVVPRENNG